MVQIGTRYLHQYFTVHGKCTSTLQYIIPAPAVNNTRYLHQYCNSYQHCTVPYQEPQPYCTIHYTLYYYIITLYYTLYLHQLCKIRDSFRFGAGNFYGGLTSEAICPFPEVSLDCLGWEVKNIWYKKLRFYRVLTVRNPDFTREIRKSDNSITYIG